MAGQRRQCLKTAIANGYVAFRTKAGAILSCFDIPHDYIISAINTDKNIHKETTLA